MVENNSKFEYIIKSLIHYNKEYRLAICQLCVSVFPKDIMRHLRKFHGILSVIERAAIVKHIETLSIQQPESVIENISLKTEIEAIEGLPVYNIARCKVCQELGAESTIMNYCWNKHNWTKSQSISNTCFTDDSSNVDRTDCTNIAL